MKTIPMKQDLTGRDWVLILLGFIIFNWFTLTLVAWILPSRRNPTLFQVIESQYDYFASKKIW